ncbi:MAG TPA: hypothetical protein VF641_00900 [Methylobacterium sp.]|jgi:hypothetical protein
MAGSLSLTTFDDEEFGRIESAMGESARGRWFLQEYARRNRSADTDMLLGAIQRLEGVVTSERQTVHVERVRDDIMDMAQAIARTKAEISAISAPDHDHSRLNVASVALDAIVRATERATSEILSAAENVQEAAWTLREAGSDGAICDALDRDATQIYTACSFQDLTAQRTARIVQTLRYLEERLAAMIAIWDDGAAPSPAAAADPIVEEELCQSDVDRFIDMESAPGKSAPGPSAPARPSLSAAIPLHEDVVFLPATPEADGFDGADAIADDASPPEDEADAEPVDIEAAFADIDGLTTKEKLALFS